MGYLTVRLTTTLSLGSGVTAVTGTSAAEYLRWVHFSMCEFVYVCMLMGASVGLCACMPICVCVCVCRSIKSCEKTQLSLFKWLKCWLMTKQLRKTNRATLSHLLYPFHSCSFFLFLITPLANPHSSLCSRFLICVICCCFSVPYLFPLFPFLFLSSPPGWREALPPQLCQVFPLSHDVPGRRGNVPYRWGERQRCFRLCTANRHKNRLVVSIELAVPCKHPDGLSVSASVEVCV